MPDERSDAPSPEQVTERTDREWLEAQVRELEATTEGLLATNRQLTQRVHFLRGEIDRLGRIVRIGGVVRGAVRDPGRLRLLRMDLSQALQPRPLPEPPGEARPPDASILAAAGRSVVLEAVDRRRRDGGVVRQVSGLRIGLVADPPLHALLAGTCFIVPLRPDDGPATIAEAGLDLVLVESAWAGQDGAWRARLAWHPHPRSVALADLTALLGAARTAGVPTAFWMTAARHDLGRFAAAARRFDHLFATDDAVLDRLASDRERRWVSAEVLPPGVRVDVHHPRGLPDDRRPVFVGSVPLALPIERREAIGRLLAAALAHEVVVCDRQAGGDPARFGLPAPFPGEVIRQRTDAIVDLYRRHAVVLLPSFVADSASVVPARLFEALASGAPVITTRADAISSVVGGELAVASDDAVELSAALEAALDGSEIRERVRAAAATVARAHDIRRRIARIARTAGLQVHDPATSVDVLIVADDPADFPRLVAGLASEADATSAVVIGTTAWESAREVLPGALASALPGRPVRLVEQSSEETLAQRHRRLAAVAGGERVAIVEAGPGSHGSWSAAGGLAGLIGCAEASGAAVVAVPRRGAVDAHSGVTSVDAFPALLARPLVEERGWPSAGEGALDGWAAAGTTFHAAEPAWPDEGGARP